MTSPSLRLGYSNNQTINQGRRQHKMSGGDKTKKIETYNGYNFRSL